MKTATETQANTGQETILVRVRKLAARYSVCERTITNWVKRGMPCRKVGGVVLFDPVACDAWIATH